MLCFYLTASLRVLSLSFVVQIRQFGFCQLAMLLLPISVFSQIEPYNFYKLDTYNGLSHNQVTAILKDQDGFLWFGTGSGLNRYDGYTCRIFRKNFNDSSSLLDNTIQSLYELPEGKMWVSTSGGPCIYNFYTEKFENDYFRYLRSLGLPTAPINNIVKGKNGRYWFLYYNLDLYLYSTAEKKAASFMQKPGIKRQDKIISIKESDDGRLWLLYQRGH